jgi:hypothetical protein
MARRKSTPSQTNTAPEDSRGRLEREGGLEETPIENAKVEVSGSHVVLYAWDDIDGRVRRIDKLTKAVMSKHATHNEYRGVSERLSGTVRLRGEDAMVTWRLFPKGCQDCDS